MQCGLDVALQDLGEEFSKDKFPMQIYIKMPWEI